MRDAAMIAASSTDSSCRGCTNRCGMIPPSMKSSIQYAAFVGLLFNNADFGNEFRARSRLARRTIIRADRRAGSDKLIRDGPCANSPHWNRLHQSQNPKPELFRPLLQFRRIHKHHLSAQSAIGNWQSAIPLALLHVLHHSGWREGAPLQELLAQLGQKRLVHPMPTAIVAAESLQHDTYLEDFGLLALLNQ